MKFRKNGHLTDYKVRKQVMFSKNELLHHLYTLLNPIPEKIEFASYGETSFDALKIDEGTWDLRKIGIIDGHGVICLLCDLMFEMKKENKYVHLLIDEGVCLLKSMNFFGVLKQYLNSKIFWDDTKLNSTNSNVPILNIKLPLTRLGVVGAHAKSTDDLILRLYQEGLSRDVCSYIGWAIGELADNASTHSQTYPGFIFFEQHGENKNFFQFTIGDIGVGIPSSLKKKSKYHHLSDDVATLSAFKSNVSGRSDEEQRGKGLTDVLKIAMECSTRIKVETNDLGFILQFDSGRLNFHKHEPLYRNSGTIISMVFKDGLFSSFNRDDVNKYIDKCLSQL